MNERKKILMTLSKSFPLTHSRKREATDFSTKLRRTLDGKQGDRKIHTIRSNYTQWKHNLDKVIDKQYFISVREWSGRPYHTKQIELYRIYAKVSYQSIRLVYRAADKSVSCTIDGRVFTDLDLLAKNDGLSRQDFLEWYFPILSEDRDRSFEGIIIHFTDFRY